MPGFVAQRFLSWTEQPLRQNILYISLLRIWFSTNGARIRSLGGKQEDLAQMVGLCRETTSRLLARLKQRQILDWDYSTLVVRNWSAL